jgi:hypothetical protein
MASSPCCFAANPGITWHAADGSDCTPDDFIMQSDVSTTNASRHTFVACGHAVRHGILNTPWQGVTYADQNTRGQRRASINGDIFVEAACIEGNQKVFDVESLSAQRVCRKIRDMCAGNGALCPVPYVDPAPKPNQKPQTSGPYFVKSIKQKKVCQCDAHEKSRKVSKTIRDSTNLPSHGLNLSSTVVTGGV